MVKVMVTAQGNVEYLQDTRHMLETIMEKEKQGPEIRLCFAGLYKTRRLGTKKATLLFQQLIKQLPCLFLQNVP